MEFSIIIPVPANEPEAQKAIDSVIAQTRSDFELIIVQYGSFTRPVKLPSGYGRRLRLLMEDTNSPEEAKNIGASVAAGKYLIFLDPFDLLLPWALEIYSRILIKEQNPLVLVGKVIREDSYQSRTAYKGVTQYVTAADYLSKDREVHLTQSVIVISKEEYIKTGGFTPGTFPADDLDFFLKIGCSGPAVLITNPATIVYRYHKANTYVQIQTMVQKLKTIINLETAHTYPGGNSRRLQRQALIGGPVFNWVKKNIKLHNYKLAYSLILHGSKMMAAGGLKKAALKLKDTPKPRSLTPGSPGYRPASNF